MELDLYGDEETISMDRDARENVVKILIKDLNKMELLPLLIPYQRCFYVKAVVLFDLIKVLVYSSRFWNDAPFLGDVFHGS